MVLTHLEPKAESAGVPVLSVHDIDVVKGPRKILSVDHLQVNSGEVLAVIGPNGAGKSTLISVMACLDTPYHGDIVFKGQKVNRKNALNVRRRMAVVFQEPLLLDGTVRDNVKLGLTLRNQSIDDGRIDAWLGRFGLTALAGQLVHTLSGGEAQRTALARAFVLEPEVLFLDEPFASVDVITRQDLVAQFRDILREQGTTTVLVTHDFAEVQALASRVLVLAEGRIQSEGTPGQIQNHPVWQKLTNRVV